MRRARTNPAAPGHAARSTSLSLSLPLPLSLPALVALLVAPGLLSSCGASDRDRPDVLLIVVDTLRADRLGVYGNERELTPYLDAWAATARRFDAAFAHAPWTLPSTASLFTSLVPQQHGAGGSLALDPARGDGGFRSLDPRIPTIAERFRDAGYATASIVNVDFLTETFGMTRGFEHIDAKTYASNREARSATETTDAALAWLEVNEDRPCFLFVHYFDAHAVYSPPPSFRRRFADPRDREDDDFVFGTRAQMIRLRTGELALSPDVIERASRLYDGEVAYVDSEIGRLFAVMAERDRADSTIVVVTSDHGEEFLDHGGFEHGHTLYQELLHVPLLIAWPGRIEPGVTSSIVGLADVAPTLCELAGLSAPATFAGTSLAPYLLGAEYPPQHGHMAHGNFWGRAKRSWTEGEFKLILDLSRDAPGARAELYRWRADPEEREELGRALPEVRRRLIGHLVDQERRLPGLGTGPRAVLGPEELERLRSLGYVGEDR